MRPLLPVLKEKKRYLVFEVESNNKKNLADVQQAITRGCLDYLGEKGSAEAGLLLIKNKFSIKKQRGILKVSNKSLNNVKAALTLINNINNDKAAITTIGVSGSIRKAQKKFMG